MLLQCSITVQCSVFRCGVVFPDSDCLGLVLIFIYDYDESNKEQAGAEMWQAQKKLGLAKLDLHSMKLYLKIEVFFHISYN
jgi:hypothetical protein